VWAALGDPAGYVEPFAGSLAVLLARPPFKGRRVETVNDADGWLVNTWRAIQLNPVEVARHCWGPVTEIDYHARLAWLQERRTDGLVSWLEGDPQAHDPKAAGWWLYVCAAGIGDPFGSGPWRVVDGRMVDTRELPHLGDAGQGDSGIDRLVGYLNTLAHRIQHVRITCGDWRRVTQPSVHRSGTGGDGTRALFLDPPYATSGDLYAIPDGGGQVSTDVREWCTTAPANLRIVLAGYDTEHNDLLTHGWTRIEGRAGRGAGYSTNPTNGRRERLWLSPACIQSGQGHLFDHEGIA
jgi:hypothetical protein